MDLQYNESGVTYDTSDDKGPGIILVERGC